MQMNGRAVYLSQGKMSSYFFIFIVSFYPPLQKTTGLPVDKCISFLCFGAMSFRNKADHRGVAEGEDGYINGTMGLPVGLQ
jgi:hypothetical protein